MAGRAAAKRSRSRARRRGQAAKSAALPNGDPVETAKDAGLRYASGESPGITCGSVRRSAAISRQWSATHKIDLHNRGLAEVVSKCQDLPGQELLQYIDEDGEVVDVGSSDVNEYSREITGEDFTAKDFRTWAGTVLAARALKEFDAFHS